MKRVLDLLVSVLGLLILSPLFALIAVLVKLGDGGPVFYRQERIGWRGRPFLIWKFRTMRVNSEKLGLSITKLGDPRITKIGGLLRKTKLDELPQLINVLIGEMSLVGPRPEVPRYVALYTLTQRQVLELQPGITDLASLEFRNEEALLSLAVDEEKYYCEYCIPTKIELNLRYAAKASLLRDIVIILRTIVVIVARSRLRDADMRNANLR